MLLKKLDQAKKKVQMLVKTNVGDPAMVSFDEDVAADESPEEPAA